MGLLAEVQTAYPTSRLAQLTNAGNPGGTSAVNLTVLGQAVYYAQAHFYSYTGVPYDDTTATGPPPSGNTCHFVGVALVIAYLYRFRGLPTEAADAEKAWQTANDQLARWARQFGALQWAAPQTDSVLSPSTPVPGTRPDFDDARLRRIVPNDPGAGNSLGTSDFA